MLLQVLGRYSPFPAPNGACPGYLLEHQGEHILLECGSGVLSRLPARVPIAGLSTVILSHLHSDHCSDVSVLRYAADARLRLGWHDRPVYVYAPPEPADEFRRLAYREAMVLESIAPGAVLTVGGFRVEFFPVSHSLPGVAMRITAGGRILAYSGDTGPCPGVVEAAQGADLFLCEATLQDGDGPGTRLGHLTGGEAGRLAGAAGVDRLVLTHFFPGHHPEERAGEARAYFSGRVEVAQEGALYQV
ncbi:MAG TPA: MBL fold metallo-hydrolase [Clostridiales bacterium UBA8153]|nr:MBL fold metallo-hydrolase [Clostridiales bacterium UBA8153]